MPRRLGSALLVARAAARRGRLAEQSRARPAPAGGEKRVRVGERSEDGALPVLLRAAGPPVRRDTRQPSKTSARSSAPEDAEAQSGLRPCAASGLPSEAKCPRGRGRLVERWPLVELMGRLPRHARMRLRMWARARRKGLDGAPAVSGRLQLHDAAAVQVPDVLMPLPRRYGSPRRLVSGRMHHAWTKATMRSRCSFASTQWWHIATKALHCVNQRAGDAALTAPRWFPLPSFPPGHLSAPTTPPAAQSAKRRVRYARGCLSEQARAPHGSARARGRAGVPAKPRVRPDCRFSRRQAPCEAPSQAPGVRKRGVRAPGRACHG